MNNATTNVTNLNVSKGNSNLQIGTKQILLTSILMTLKVLKSLVETGKLQFMDLVVANGVVLISTKKGKSGKPTFNFSTSITSNSLRKKVYVNMSDKQFVNSSAASFPIQNQPASATTVSVAGRNLETRTILVFSAMITKMIFLLLV